MQLRDLSTVLIADGPFVTVHVGAESAVEQAADRYELAWKNILRELEDRDVPEKVRGRWTPPAASTRTATRASRWRAWPPGRCC